MSKDRAKSLSDLIGTGENPLGRLADEANRWAGLSEHLRGSLPAPLGEGLLHCNIDPENTVTVLAASPEWAARLRYETSAILRLTQQKEPGIEQVKVRVAAI